MLTITVDLLLGTYRADPTGLAHTGQLTQGEWPPAPLRLLAALVAADGTRERCRHTTGEELAFLEAASPPTVYASPLQEVHHQRLHHRFVVQQTPAAVKKAHQEYQGRSGAQVRPGVRVAPRSSRVVFAWDADPSDAVLEGLRARAARVGYLGAADSPVSVQVSRAMPDCPAGEAYEPADDGDLAIGVPRPGVVGAMDSHFDRWQDLGPSIHRSHSPGLRRLARYRSPGSARMAQEPGPTILWLRFDRPVSGRRVTAVTSAFKAALLDHYQRAMGEPPAVLHGHVSDPAQSYALAYFLALPDVGHARATGQIHGMALVLPVGTDDETVTGCRTALHQLAHLHGAGFERGVSLWSGEDRPLATNPARWLRKGANRFATAFPALHERRGVAVSLDEVARWCEHSGLPAPVAARSSRGPLLAGGIDLAPSEVNRPGRPGLPYSHLEVVFEKPIQGLVVIGSGRQRGLGLCAPVDRRR